MRQPQRLTGPCLPRCVAGVLHEHPRIGSDGESEEVSLASDPDVTSPVKMRQKSRRLSEVSCRFLISFASVLFWTKEIRTRAPEDRDVATGNLVLGHTKMMGKWSSRLSDFFVNRVRNGLLIG